MNHRAFIYQDNGIVTVSNGVDTVIFPTPAAWAEASVWTLPDNVTAVAYEHLGSGLLYHRISADGMLEVQTELDAAIEALIDDVAALAQTRAVQVANPLWGIADVAVARERAKGIVDAGAEAARGAYITLGSGQAMVYQEKETEARALKAAVTGGLAVDAAAYPHLAAEVNITAQTIEAVADTILALAGAWRQASAGIESKRLATKAEIAGAGDVASIRQILARLTWVV